MKHVRQRQRGSTRISAKNQATIPVQAMREAGLKAGDVVRVVADGRGRIVLEHQVNVIERHAGSLPDVYPAGELNALRDEWRA
jgi:bifunctional DNA-binding transcriptional regulator/antitoxin component of YhaV-PrlF toxin-antitoxin module